MLKTKIEPEVVAFNGRPMPAPSKFISTLSPYDAVSSLDSISQLPAGLSPLKLDWNESVVPPSPRVIDEITKFLRNSHHINWYPDLGAAKLRKTLVAYTGVPADDIIVTNGSDDALALVVNSYVDPGDDVVLVWPTYGHFLVHCRGRGVEPRLAAPEDPFDNPTSTLMKTLRSDTKLAYIASPNNPTGVVVPPDNIVELCSEFPSTLFLVDEAYYEFCGITSARLVTKIPNLVVTRTFSKCLSMAGLRVGYLMASGEVMKNLRRLYNPKSVNVLGQVGAAAALLDFEFISNYVNECRAGRTWLVQALAERGIDVHTSAGNFILVRVKDPAQFCHKLESVGVFVRDRSAIKGFDGYVRITIGPVEYMKEFVRRLDMLRVENPDIAQPWSAN